MWLDQDLLKMSEEQRRGAAASTTVTAPRQLTATTMGAEQRDPALAGFQLVETVAATDKGAQAHGYAKGFAAGWAAGQRRAVREAAQEKARMDEEFRMADEARADAFADAMEAVRSLGMAVQNRDDMVAEDMKSALATAAIELAEALLGAELSDGPAGAKAALHRALAEVDPQDVVCVHMHPSDIEMLKAHEAEAEVLSDLSPSGHSPVQLVPDPQLEVGDAVTQMPEGFLDARLSTALARARKALETLREVGGEL